MTDQEHLEKTYYWNEDEERVSTRVREDIVYGSLLGGKQRKARVYTPPSLKVAEPQIKTVSTKHHTGWNGFEAYWQQCKEAEKRNT